MTVYQFYLPQPVLLNLAGIGPIPNGKIYFYEIGTTTEADTWSNYAKGDAYLNANPVLLDSSGRPSTEVWLDGAYTVRVDDGDGVTVNTFDMRPAADDAASIPIPEDDEYLGGDGSAYIAKKYRGLPDPTGLIGYFPVSDGEGYVMTPTPEPPAPPTPEYVIGDTSIRIGNFMIQTGTDALPASGNYYSQKTLTFPVPFTKLLGISPTLNTTVVGVQTGIPSLAATGWTFGSPSTSVTIYARNMPVGEHDDSNDYITQTVPYSWVAVGLVAE